VGCKRRKCRAFEVHFISLCYSGTRTRTSVSNFHLFIAVSDIHCTYRSSSSSTSSPGIISSSSSSSSRDSISARLRKPESFKGSPLFADDRSVDPLTDEDCQIRPDPLDPNKLIYNLLVTDFNRCGVSRRNVSISNLFSHSTQWSSMNIYSLSKSDSLLLEARSLTSEIR